MNDLMVEQTDIVESSRSRIANYIRGKILSNEFKPGEQLPTTRELAQAAKVSGHTVRLAMTRLEDEGLVYSARGSGTFVSPQSTIDSNHDTALKAIAIMGALSDDELLPDRYRFETNAGYMKEAENCGLIAQVFPNLYRKLPAVKLLEVIRATGCGGIIWSSPTGDERQNVEKTIESGMPVVVTYRADVTDWLPMVAADFVYGGYQAGSYLKSKGCGKVFVLGYTVNSKNKPMTMSDGLPNGLISGLSEGLGVDVFDRGKINREIIAGYDRAASVKILEILSTVRPGEGVIFSNAYNFRNLLRDFSTEAKQLLASIPFVIIGNTTILRKISPFAQDIDFPVIGDPFEEIARIAIQKLVSVADGKLENTKTLLKPYFEMFWNIGAAKGDDDN